MSTKVIASGKERTDAVAVKIEGSFTEWYSPNYVDPYENDEVYRKWFNENLLDTMPVLGPAIGDDEDENITDDMQCLCERMCCDCTDDWQGITEDLKNAVEDSLRDGRNRVFRTDSISYDIKITTYTKEEMPPVNEKSVKLYGPYEKLMRERVAAI